MRKKILCLVFAVLLLFALVACKNHTVPKELEDLEAPDGVDYGITWTPLKEFSRGTVEAVWSDTYFSNINIGEEEFPKAKQLLTVDEFGGVYIDENGIFNICVVGDREPYLSDYLIYRHVEHSYGFLYGIMWALGNKMTELTIWSCGTNERNNRVDVFMEDKKKIPNLIEYLRENDLFRESAINVIIGRNNIVLN